MSFHQISFFFLVLLAFSCTTGVDSQEIHLNNNNGTTIMVNLWDLESSKAVDPNPVVAIDDVPFLQVKSQESAVISKSKIKGNSDAERIRLFLYEVRGDSAYLQNAFSFSSSREEITIHHGADGYSIK